MNNWRQILSWSEESFDVSDIKGVREGSFTYVILNILQEEQDSVPLKKLYTYYFTTKAGNEYRLPREVSSINKHVATLTFYSLITVSNNMVTITPKGKYWLSVLASKRDKRRQTEPLIIKTFPYDILPDIRPFISEVYLSFNNVPNIIISSKKKLVRVHVTLDKEAFTKERRVIVNEKIEINVKHSFSYDKFGLLNYPLLKNNVKIGIENIPFEEIHNMYLQHYKEKPKLYNWYLNMFPKEDIVNKLNWDYEKDKDDLINQYLADLALARKENDLDVIKNIKKRLDELSRL
jgi:hypothetical protein